MSIKNVEALVDNPIIAVIPETDDTKRALNAKHPLVYSYPKSHASIAFNKLAGGLVGGSYEDDIEEKKGFLETFLLRFGLKR